MKKIPLLIVLSGLVSVIYPDKEDLFKKIETDSFFRFEDYKNYTIGFPIKDTKKGIVKIFYDLDKNGEPDLFAAGKMTKIIDGAYFIGPYAFLIGVDKNEDRICEKFYLDTDNNGLFDEEAILINNKKDKDKETFKI